MFTPDQYQLLDFGDGRKLERFGAVVLDRPAPAAAGAARLEPSLWSAATGSYERTAGDHGVWRWQANVPEPWTIIHDKTTLELKPTEFGHLGFFPEQAAHWDWIAEQVRLSPKPAKVLNLFAYTGAATLAAAGAGAEVTHVDSARSTVAWARRNVKRSGLAAAPIRWIVEDATRFVRRELKRGNRYQAVVLDPPSYGHGPKGEVWKLQEQLPDLMRLCAELTADECCFVLLSCHSPGFDGRKLGELLLELAAAGEIETMEMAITTNSGRSLLCGCAARFRVVIPSRHPQPHCANVLAIDLTERLGQNYNRTTETTTAHRSMSMAVSPVQPASKLLDKRALQKAVADLDYRMGFVQDPTATAEKAQAMMLARGIRPADRFLSGDIIRMRHEQEEE